MPTPDKFRLQAERSLLLVVDVQDRLSSVTYQDGLQRAV